jgi:PSP1 C-terminal conserved region
MSHRRVDFRELVRDLFSVYKTRIWMEQVKDSSKNNNTTNTNDNNTTNSNNSANNANNANNSSNSGSAAEGYCATIDEAAVADSAGTATTDVVDVSNSDSPLSC